MENTTSSTEALNRAIKMRGGIVAFSRELGLNGHAVANQWRLSRVPAERCIAIEELTNGAVRCEDLRPDVNWGVLRNQHAEAA